MLTVQSTMRPAMSRRCAWIEEIRAVGGALSLDHEVDHRCPIGPVGLDGGLEKNALSFSTIGGVGILEPTRTAGLVAIRVCEVIRSGWSRAMLWAIRSPSRGRRHGAGQSEGVEQNRRILDQIVAGIPGSTGIVTHWIAGCRGSRTE